MDGADHVDARGSFWVGLDGGGKLHALWQQEVDPFSRSSTYDVMHAVSPVSSLRWHELRNREESQGIVFEARAVI